MDNIDIKIIHLLQKNARITASEIGNEINLSVSAVSDRLKKLETTGIIEQFTTIVNPKQMGKTLTAIMFVTLERPKYTEKFLEVIKDEDEILECHYLAGDFDYAMKIITDNTISLESILNRIKSIQGVQKTKTIVALSTIKNNHSIILKD